MVSALWWLFSTIGGGGTLKVSAAVSIYPDCTENSFSILKIFRAWMTIGHRRPKADMESLDEQHDSLDDQNILAHDARVRTYCTYHSKCRYAGT
jgi:hypothetical protein